MTIVDEYLNVNYIMKLTEKEIEVVCEAAKSSRDTGDINKFREWLKEFNRYSIDCFLARRAYDKALEGNREWLWRTLAYMSGTFGEWQFCQILYRLTEGKAHIIRFQKHLDGVAHMCSGEFLPDYGNQRRVPDTMFELNNKLIYCEIKKQPLTIEGHIGGAGNYRIPKREYDDFKIFKPLWLAIYDSSHLGKYSIVNEPQEWRAGVINGEPLSEGYLGEPEVHIVKSFKDFQGGGNYCFWHESKFIPLGELLKGLKSD